MDEEILQEFLAESWENLSRLDREIVSLEKDPQDAELLASIFRTIHTIKGTCGFLGLARLGSVAHAVENVLGRMRDGALEATPHAISRVLEGVDVIKDLLQGLEATREEPAHDNSAVIARMNALAEGKPAAGARGERSPAAEPVAEPAASEQAPAAAAESSEAECAEIGEAPDREPAIETTHASVQTMREAPRHVPAALPADPAPRPVPAAPSARHESIAEAAPHAEGDKRSASDMSLRVGIDVLDSLMNLVGELVLARNQLLQMIRGDDDSKFASPISQLNRVTADLQEGVMKARMQPIGNAFTMLPRLVRDLSQFTKKPIALELSGADTELDRVVLDAIRDPLTHIVRNSADHGIEPADRRRALGKPETGTIRVDACHEGGHVVICVTDDGGGIDTQKVLQKAITQGALSAGEAAGLDENEIIKLLFRPGFSTADQVSPVSGRGVGMDVVKTCIERIGGTVALTSRPNVGTTIRIKIPLTLAIVSSLIIECGGESFAIPQLAVVEVVRLSAEERSRIETIHDAQVLRLRDLLLPLVSLHQILDLPADADEERDLPIVVVQVADERFGLIVSDVTDTEEIVVKPAGSLLGKVGLYQGTTILGDGRVIMILDVAGIAAQFGLTCARSAVKRSAADPRREEDERTTRLLLFAAGDGTTLAVPVSLVARLEEIPQSSIERCGDRLCVQYRGDLLPVQEIAGMEAATDAPDPRPVIVFTEGRRSMGLLVHKIQDIVEERLIIRMQSQRPGVLGTAIINGHATDVIDTHYYVMQADPNWFAEARERREDRRVLIVENSVFFRQLVTTALESAFYRVSVAESAALALERIDRGETFDAIVSDVELPGIDGCEFARQLRTRAATRNVPVIALSALPASAGEARALEAGFSRYLVKFQSQQLFAAIDELCGPRSAAWGVSA